MSAITLVANGDAPPSGEIRGSVYQNHPILAVDGGADHCLKLGLSPAWIVGDMDSLSEEAKNRFSKVSEFIEVPRNKDEMDFEVALRCAKTFGATRVVAFSCTSPSADYTYGNLRIASRCGIPIQMIDSNGWSTFLSNVDRSVQILARDKVRHVSVFPFSPRVSLTSTGLKWELRWDRVPLDTVSQSNELVGGRACIDLVEGVAWVSIERPFS